MMIGRFSDEHQVFSMIFTGDRDVHVTGYFLKDEQIEYLVT